MIVTMPHPTLHPCPTPLCASSSQRPGDLPWEGNVPPHGKHTFWKSALADSPCPCASTIGCSVLVPLRVRCIGHAYPTAVHALARRCIRHRPFSSGPLLMTGGGVPLCGFGEAVARAARLPRRHGDTPRHMPRHMPRHAPARGVGGPSSSPRRPRRRPPLAAPPRAPSSS